MTRRKFISDSTPLIALARIGELEVVRHVFEEILVPEAVHEEIVEARGGAPGAEDVAAADWVHRTRVAPRRVAPLLRLMDRGEAEAIALARVETGSLLLTDDRKARRTAKELGIQVQGTLGILARAKGQGLVPSIRPLTQRLQSSGWRISESILAEFLRRSGE